MNWADYIILAVLGISVLIGLWRGLISEVLGLLIWVTAAWITWTFGPHVAELYANKISLPSARLAAGYATTFVGVLVLGIVLRFLVARLVQGTGLSGTDRLLGMLFGLARGVLVVTIGVFLVSLTALTRDPWWQQSTLLPQFTGVAGWLNQQVPGSARRFLQQPTSAMDQLPSLPDKLPDLHLPSQLPSQMPQLPSQLQGLQGLPAALQGLAPAPARSAARAPGVDAGVPRDPGATSAARDPKAVEAAPRQTTNP